MSLSDMLGLVKRAVSLMFEDDLWLTAEILHATVKGGHTYLELVEYDDDRRERAKIKGMIWKGNANILTKFQKTTNNPIASGMKILFKAMPTFHEVYGLSLTVTDIDPTYTLGDMEARLNDIRKHLQDKGWWNMNRSLATPGEFCRIAVISPADAAGLGDFRVDADKLEGAGLCSFQYFNARFQGQESSNQIVDKMIEILDIHKQNPFDACVMIRGGGDKAGLYQLNHARLATAVCRFPVPVLVGIGHERDSVILDEVANQRFPTPSLLIAHIKHTIFQNAQAALANWERIQNFADRILVRAQNACDQQLKRIESSATRQVDNAESRLNSQAVRLVHASETALGRAERKLESAGEVLTRNALVVCEKADKGLEAQRDRLFREADAVLTTAQHQLEMKASSLMNANPIAILGRGYAYVSHGSRIVTKVDQVASGDLVQINLKEGSISAIVQEQEHA
jgi:exodeoxyribonuclease VII large subunit